MDSSILPTNDKMGGEKQRILGSLLKGLCKLHAFSVHPKSLQQIDHNTSHQGYWVHSRKSTAIQDFLRSPKIPVRQIILADDQE
jgi:hypothetical protein